MSKKDDLLLKSLRTAYAQYYVLAIPQMALKPFGQVLCCSYERCSESHEQLGATIILSGSEGLRGESKSRPLIITMATSAFLN
eukprot:CCRYP_003539-RA/>CCRYP_003539-RA protein AED:0.22 eAED:0.22 QI:0/0.75/0.8/1/0/0/5/1895/82